MATTSHGLRNEVEELVLEQIRAFKEVRTLDDRDILEYHLRYYQIMALFRQLDRSIIADSLTV